MNKKLLILLLTSIVLVLESLTACGYVGQEPSRQLVQRALELQLSQTQQQLSQQLHFSVPPKFEIERLNITEEQPLEIGNLSAYKIQGTYNLTMELQKRQITQQHKTFEVYIQRQQEGKTWRLAVPRYTSEETNPIWHTYLIQ